MLIATTSSPQELCPGQRSMRGDPLSFPPGIRCDGTQHPVSREEQEDLQDREEHSKGGEVPPAPPTNKHRFLIVILLYCFDCCAVWIY